MDTLALHFIRFCSVATFPQKACPGGFAAAANLLLWELLLVTAPHLCRPIWGLPLGTHQASIPATILVYQLVSYSPVSTCCELLIGGCTSLIFNSSAPSTAPAQAAPGHVVRKLSLPSFLWFIRRWSKVWGGGELKSLPPEIGCLAICTAWATVTVVFLCVPTVPIHEQIESELPTAP